MLYAPGETGQGLVEYALIIAFIAILLIAALGFISGGLNNIYSNIASNL
jgi:pilus assembly protein Flp/PilA